MNTLNTKLLLRASAVLALAPWALADEPEALPVCSYGGPYFAECTGASTAVPLDGSASFDPDGTPLIYQWIEECPFGFIDDPSVSQPNFVIDMTGQCQRACFVGLRVFSGGQGSLQDGTCSGYVTVSDTTAPVLALPINVVGPWGLDTSVASLGAATATDLCDPSPALSFADTVIPSQGPGHEQTIIRRWTASDRCGFFSSLDQLITLTSPGASVDASFNVDLDINACPDVLVRATQGPRIVLTLLGRANLYMNGVNRSTVKLSRQADPANFVTPTNPWLYSATQIGVFAASNFGDCNPAGTDGRADLRFQFNYAQVESTLGLNSLPAGTAVPIQMFGLRTNGTQWIAYGEITVQ
ncbi:MAG: hypothetical protein FJ298_11470 [Planctomycetes bacterium]|nr:hypothetical protein [Planctomycetota bacterium]